MFIDCLTKFQLIHLRLLDYFSDIGCKARAIEVSDKKNLSTKSFFSLRFLTTILMYTVHIYS